MRESAGRTTQARRRTARRPAVGREKSGRGQGYGEDSPRTAAGITPRARLGSRLPPGRRVCSISSCIRGAPHGLRSQNSSRLACVRLSFFLYRINAGPRISALRWDGKSSLTAKDSVGEDHCPNRWSVFFLEGPLPSKKSASKAFSSSFLKNFLNASLA